MSELADDIIENDLQVFFAQVVRTAGPNVEVDVFRHRRDDDSGFDQGLNNQVVDFVPITCTQLSELRMIAADQFIPDVKSRMRPRTLGQILNDFADALFAFDE